MATKPTQAKSAKAATPRNPSKAKPVVEAAPGAEAVSKEGVGLRLKGLIERVTEASGAKKKDVKEIVEATLAQMGQALARGESMNLPGLGHVRVARKASETSPVMTLKLRQGEGGKGKGKSTEAGEDALAEDSDQG